MKSLKIRLCKFVVIAGFITPLLFTSCQKENIVKTTDEIESIGDLAAQNADRLLINDKNGVQERYIVMLKDTYLRPAIFDEQQDAMRPSSGKDPYANKRQSIVNGVEQFIEEVGIDREKVTDVYGHLLAGFTAVLTVKEVKTLLLDPRIEGIEQDLFFEINDKLEITEQSSGGMSPEAQVTPCGITRHGGAGNGSGSNKWIWIVDSGIQSNHPDLNVVTNPTYARSFVGGTFQDCNGHGTHVAGTAAAKHNNIGVIGMSAGAWVVPIKIMAGCGGSYYSSTLISALNHIASYDEPGDVVNLSIGGYAGPTCSNSSPLRTAIQNLGNSGTWVIIAAGNSNAYAGYYQPACYNGTRILTIANMTCQNTWNPTSNYNLPMAGGPIDWIAVGTNVFSTYIGSSYATMSGTSMSAPHVSGIVHWRQGGPLQKGIVAGYGVNYKVASRN